MLAVCRSDKPYLNMCHHVHNLINKQLSPNRLIDCPRSLILKYFCGGGGGGGGKVVFCHRRGVEVERAQDSSSVGGVISVHIRLYRGWTKDLPYAKFQMHKNSQRFTFIHFQSDWPNRFETASK